MQARLTEENTKLKEDYAKLQEEKERSVTREVIFFFALSLPRTCDDVIAIVWLSRNPIFAECRSSRDWKPKFQS